MSMISTIRRARWSIGVLVLGVAAVAAIINFLHKPAPTVRVASPRYQDLISSISTNGRVLPVNDFEARAAFSGTVEKVYVEVGEKVKPGQLLIKLKDPFAAARVATANAALQSSELVDRNVHKGGSQEDFINFKDDLTHARVTEAEAKSGLAALKALQQKGAASAGEVNSQEHRLELADATLQALKDRSTSRYAAEDLSSSAAHLADARAGLATAKVVLADANITSSIAGTVYFLPVSNYDFVPMGADLLRVADLSKVQVRAYFDEPDIGQLAAGQPVEVTWDAKPNRSWHGRLKQVPLTVRPMGARNVGESLIAIDDGDGSLLPNTDVSIKVIVTQRKHALTIPHEALHAAGGASFVYRVINDRLVRTPVTVGLTNVDRVEITSGLSEHDVIALDATTNTDLSDSLKVEVAR